MPRELNLRLESLLQERAPGTRRRELAKSLGISEALVRTYLENRWTVLDRTVLERLADYFDCDAGTLLATTESTFFDTFRTLSGKEASAGSPFCVYVYREDADRVIAGRGLAHRDHQAVTHVDTFLRNRIDRMTSREVSAPTNDKFQQHVVQNCIVVGSPMVNPAAEIAICRLFGVEPFDVASQSKLPFAFRNPLSSETLESAIIEPGSDGKRGLWLRDENELIPCDYWPPEAFKQRRISRGHDCGLIMVANHRPAELSGISRKLVVLAGFGGTGTEAAAKALVHHFRDLEPREDGDVVWGVIEVFYHKEKDSTAREDLTYNWRYRVGGRCPVALVNRSLRKAQEPQIQNR